MEILTKEELKRIARLSSLQLTDSEEQRFTKELQQVLDYANHLNNLVVTEVLQTNRAINVFREDKIKPSESSTILRNAQAISKDGYFLVPKVLKENS